MGIVSDLVKRSTSNNKYAELTDSDLESNTSKDDKIKFVDVKNQNDIVNVKEELNNNNIVIVDISYIDSQGISLDMVYEDISQAVGSNNGDVIHKKRNDIIVATPRDIGISREKI